MSSSPTPAWIWRWMAGLAGAIGLLLLFFGSRELVWAHASISWPSVTGHVVESSVESHRSAHRSSSGQRTRRSRYTARLQVRYRVQDQTLLTERIAFGPRLRSKNPTRARRELRDRAVGDSVAVFYDPARPDRAILEPGIRPGAWVWPGFGGLCLLGLGPLFLILARRAHRGSRGDRNESPAPPPPELPDADQK